MEIFKPNGNVLHVKKTILIFLLTIIIVLASCAQVQEQPIPTEEFFEKIPIVDAYHKGEKIWFIHTDVTDPQLSERLTKMVNFRTVYAPSNIQAVDRSKLAKFYVFTNGIDQTGVKPWGGGPFGFQIDIFDSVPGDEQYTSLRAPYAVTWNENANPRILKSVDDLKRAEGNGELVIEDTGVIVNAPIVHWPGGSARLN